MAAAFLLEEGRRERDSMRFSKEVEEDGIKFNVENATEDVINGLFCTYEPPTSKLEQFKAARAFRKNPKKFTSRPSVPKSILKWKFKKAKKKKEEPPSMTDNASSARFTTPTIETRDDTGGADGSESVVAYEKKSVTWRDERSQEQRTEIENTVVGLASKYCGGACNEGESIAEIMSSPTGRAAQKFFDGASSIFGTKKTDVFGTKKTDVVSVVNDGKKDEEEMKVFYDDLGNPIREDDMSASFISTTPKAAIEAAPTPSAQDAQSVPVFRSNINDPMNGGHQNLFCSNIPFMDTVIEGIGIAGVVAANAAVAAGVPENLCGGAYKVKKPASTHSRSNSLIVPRQNSEQAQISEELRQAQESLGIYEPESYDQPSEKSDSFKKIRQSTPKHSPGRQNSDENEAESQRDPPESTRSENQSKAGNQSYATSDITMGNSTIQHFSGDVSLFDESLKKEDKSLLNKKNGEFSTLVEELKFVQRKKKRFEGSAERGNIKASSISSPRAPSVKSLREGYEKSVKSPKNRSVVTNSYVNSLRSPSNRSKAADSPRAGTVASLTMRYDSPRSKGRRNFVAQTTPDSARRGIDPDVRKSVDPSESRNSDGIIHLLPPTPRRKKLTEEPPSHQSGGDYAGGELPPTPRRRSRSTTPTGYSMSNDKLRMHNWGEDNIGSGSNREAEGTTKSPSAVSVNTDAEIREAASSILDVGPRWKPRPSFKGRKLPKSLVKGPETVEDEDEEDAVDAAVEKKARKDDAKKETEEETNEAKSNERKKDKKKRKSSKFAGKFKKSMEKALEPVLNATRKVESQRIG
mmetsp:Transcript_17051/g.39346  ORF Transcript_17051/g.39346 Transcript_17051/m.39346 type:complete len:806 (+) Transcript_17051:110-2527(+)|eukprot:CAMPEP_0197175866 /NCGR_PEP_ID=MMETSP1423-20130617/1966_1 /TAXON_ID=476441 /ORGANISM="Pseudo-nitzschia heimii, Strain UNC1101" /LENGTH=805 /DNA_ID=CAMNT_0042625115 /DNA_START=71 /DNA_END=2488 /DNA_ORIENTATION=-